MSIIASLFEDSAEGKPKPLGDHEFVALPAVGDFVTETSMGGTTYVLRVVRVEHWPVPVKDKLNEADVPHVHVHVKTAGVIP